MPRIARFKNTVRAAPGVALAFWTNDLQLVVTQGIPAKIRTSGDQRLSVEPANAYPTSLVAPYSEIILKSAG